MSQSASVEPSEESPPLVAKPFRRSWPLLLASAALYAAMIGFLLAMALL